MAVGGGPVLAAWLDGRHEREGLAMPPGHELSNLMVLDIVTGTGTELQWGTRMGTLTGFGGFRAGYGAWPRS